MELSDNINTKNSILEIDKITKSAFDYDLSPLIIKTNVFLHNQLFLRIFLHPSSSFLAQLRCA